MIVGGSSLYFMDYDTDAAPMRQLVGVKRIPSILAANSADVITSWPI